MEKESILSERYLYASTNFREQEFNTIFKTSNLML